MELLLHITINNLKRLGKSNSRYCSNLNHESVKISLEMIYGLAANNIVTQFTLFKNSFNKKYDLLF